MRIRKPGRRRGMTIVESCLVLSIFLMLLFGIFEYCRFIMVMHITNNAARDGARYAAVNVNTTDPVTTQAAIVQYTKDRMAGVTQNITSLQVAVYPVDSIGLALTPPVLRYKPVDPLVPIYPDPFNPGSLALSWNQAAFTERIAVTIQGTYTPMLPTLFFMSSTVPIYVTALTESEG